MKLSIIIPVYNEEKNIKKVLVKLFSVKLPCQKEIIVVDDGSTDGTKDGIRNYELGIRKAINTPRMVAPIHRGLLRGGGTGKELKIIHHKQNQGKGAAIQSGIKHASGDYILIQDADLEYNPEEIPQLLSPILQHKNTPLHKIVSKAVYGSRFMNNNAIIPPLYLLGNKVLTTLTNMLYGTKLTDMETGYKLLPASFLRRIKLTSARFDIEPEITAKLSKNKVPIIEVPISYKGRTHLAGKKLTIKDAIGALKALIYFRFFY